MGPDTKEGPLRGPWGMFIDSGMAGGRGLKRRQSPGVDEPVTTIRTVDPARLAV